MNLKKLKWALVPLALLGAIGLTSYLSRQGARQEENTNSTFREGTYRGFPAKISYSTGYRRVSVGFGVGGTLVGEDIDDDGRMDVVKLVGVPKGSNLEKYASIQEVEEAYKAVSREGH
jgi:hypothetical protein